MRQFTPEELNINDIFDRYSPFVREFIYKNNWQSLHEVQLVASRVLMDTDYHLLIPSSTASGIISQNIKKIKGLFLANLI